jgi:AcrR family transcriptional regulator
MIRPMAAPARSSLSGRAAEAARNDRQIYESAREVFLANPDAPITAVAQHAGVGISAVYSRYGSKEELLRRLSRDGLEKALEEIEVAAQDDRDPWMVFADFMRRLVDADIAALTLKLAGKFTPTEDMFEFAARLDTELSKLVLSRAKPVLRPGVDVGDVSQVLELVGTIKVSDPERTQELRRRYLALMLDGLRRDHSGRLPGRAPTREEINEPWEGRR